ncbi:MAG: autotransporter outer membrane beta-barrel domain-containing protein [Rhizobiaceae bacterium]
MRSAYRLWLGGAFCAFASGASVDHALAICLPVGAAPPVVFHTCAGPLNVFVPLPSNDVVAHLGSDVGPLFDLGAGIDLLTMSFETNAFGNTINGGDGLDGLILLGGVVQNVRVEGFESANVTLFSTLDLAEGDHAMDLTIVDPTSVLKVVRGQTAIGSNLAVGPIPLPSTLLMFGMLDMRDGAADDSLAVDIFTPSYAELGVDVDLAGETADVVEVSTLTLPIGDTEVLETFATQPAFNQVVGGPVALVTVVGIENPIPGLPPIVGPEDAPAPLTAATNPFSVDHHGNYVFATDPSNPERFYYLEPGSRGGLYMSWLPNPSAAAEDLIAAAGATLHGLASVSGVIGEERADATPAGPAEMGSTGDGGAGAWVKFGLTRSAKGGFAYDPLRKDNRSIFRIADATGDARAWNAFFLGGVEQRIAEGGAGTHGFRGAGSASGLTFGLYGGYLRSDVSIDNPLQSVGFGGPAVANSDYFIGGPYLRGEAGPLYVSGVASGFVGRTRLDTMNTTFADSARFASHGVLTEGNAGLKLPVADGISMDLRGTIAWGRLDARDHTTDIGFIVTDTRSETLRAGASIGFDYARETAAGSRIKAGVRAGFLRDIRDSSVTTVNQIVFTGEHLRQTMLTVSGSLEYQRFDGITIRASAGFVGDPRRNRVRDESISGKVSLTVPLN